MGFVGRLEATSGIDVETVTREAVDQTPVPV